MNRRDFLRLTGGALHGLKRTGNISGISPSADRCDDLEDLGCREFDDDSEAGNIETNCLQANSAVHSQLCDTFKGWLEKKEPLERLNEVLTAFVHEILPQYPKRREEYQAYLDDPEQTEAAERAFPSGFPSPKGFITHHLGAFTGYPKSNTQQRMLTALTDKLLAAIDDFSPPAESGHAKKITNVENHGRVICPDRL